MGHIKKILYLLVCLFLSALTHSVGAAYAQPSIDKPQKVLRYALPAAESGFDPIQVNDVYSRAVLTHIFDGLLIYDYLARPAKLKPNVAASLPVASNDFKTWTIKISPGIYFADDPAFKGQKRELIAQDFVYSFKRVYDPVWRSAILGELDSAQIIGLAELRVAAQQPGGKFDYDKEVPGIRALDRYTLQFNLHVPRPRFDQDVLVGGSAFGAVAREVVELYGDQIMEHPVGTGPFMLKEWRRSSKIVLLRNPGYREEIFEAQPAANDAQAQAIYQQLKGKRLPLIDRVELDVIIEQQPRWLAFLRNEHDYLERVPPAFVPYAIPNNQLAPNLAKRGITHERTQLLDISFTYFNMEHPVVGGYSTDRVALRRAIAIGYDSAAEIIGPRKGQAVFANGPIAPGQFGFDKQFKSELSSYDSARANALLDMFGYIDKNGDGWRDMPDGTPLVLQYVGEASPSGKEFAEVWKRSMDKLHIRFEFRGVPFAELSKLGRQGKVMMGTLVWTQGSPDGEGLLQLLYGPYKEGRNYARFDFQRYNEILSKVSRLPDGDERYALMREAEKIAVAYMPTRFSTHRIGTDLMQPWLVGYKRHPFSRDFWRYVDIDLSKRQKAK